MRGWLCMAALVPALSDDLASLLADPAAVDAFRRGCAPDEVRAVTLMAQQAVRSGIDYKTLGQGWSHPQTRLAYREARHASFTVEASRRRQAGSTDHLLALVRRLGGGDCGGGVGARAAIAGAFVVEIGASGDAPAAEFDAVLAALEGELLLPLRSLNEAQASMHRTFNGEPVPARAVGAAVRALTAAVLARAGGFAEWRYGNAVGREQLRGLSREQAAAWASPLKIERAAEGVATHEDAPGELGLFWATKIGGPSHGFDVEGQCLLPLLCNARHKVVLVSDGAWPHHPAGRAHFRLLWTDEDPTGAQRPVLWLETVNVDFAAQRVVDARPWQRAVLAHAVAKADAMGVELWVESRHQGALTEVVGDVARARGAVAPVSGRLELRPSNGVVEASDYLSHKHDWPQMEAEVVGPFRRVAYTPGPAAASDDAGPRSRTSTIQVPL